MSTASDTLSPNDRKLRDLLIEVLLIEEDEYRDEYGPAEIASWNSLATVTIAAEVEKLFGHAMEPQEMVTLQSIGDIKTFLRSRGVEFET